MARHFALVTMMDMMMTSPGSALLRAETGRLRLPAGGSR
jgi:hypothetical protein